MYVLDLKVQLENSWFMNLIPNSSNTDTLGQRLTQPTVPKHQELESELNLLTKWDLKSSNTTITSISAFKL